MHTGAITCGRLAAQAGVSADTVRYYERRGLLPAGRSAKGYRLYSAESAERLRLIRCALGLGFTIAELAEVLPARDAGGAPCRRVRQIAQAKLQEMERRRRELEDLCAALRRTLKQWDRMLTATPSGRPARLLDALARNRHAMRISPFSPRVSGKRATGEKG